MKKLVIIRRLSNKGYFSFGDGNARSDDYTIAIQEDRLFTMWSKFEEDWVRVQSDLDCSRVEVVQVIGEVE